MIKYCEKLKRYCRYYEICNTDEIVGSEEIYYNFFSQDNLEEILLVLGIKKVWKIELLDIVKLDEKIKIFKRKFFYGAYTHNESNSIIGQKLDNQTFILLLSNDNEYINKFIYYDHSDNPTGRIILTGLLLGYPECCVNKHFNSSKGIENAKKVDKDFDNPIYDKGIKCKLLNPYLRLYVHIPCSNNCIKSVINAEKILNYLENIYGEKILNFFFLEVNKGIKDKNFVIERKFLKVI